MALDGLTWRLAAAVSARAVAAYASPIMDCDETFNYWEPLHYVLFGSGLQTWEYSPEFALRTFGYLAVGGAPALLAPQGADRVALFFALRSWLGAICALGEALFSRAVARRLGPVAGNATFALLICNSGMFHSGVALLPSSTCMYCTLFAYWLWLEGRVLAGLVVGAFAVLVCWPFCALMFVPMGLDALASRGVAKVAAVAVGSAVVFIGAPALLDSFLYGRPTLAIANLVLYNALGQGGDGRGAELYGTEPWHFYLQNLLLNFNASAALALAAPAVVLVFGSPLGGAPHAGGKGGAPVGRGRLLVFFSGAFLTLGLFTAMPHKEERFLAPVYPVLCMCAATVLAVAADVWELVARRVLPAAAKPLGKALVAAVLALICLVSVSRNVALYKSFYAPLRVFQGLREVRPHATNVCVGKEWYRFPSSFLLPEQTRVLWTASSFDGLLPQPFGKWPEGLREPQGKFNDVNRGEPASISRVEECQYAVDLLVGDDFGAIGPWDANWDRVACEPFLDAQRSPALIRSFWIPFGYSEKTNVYAEYCLLRRRGAGKV